MKFYNGVLREVNNAAGRVSILAISRIEVGERLYPVDEENVARLTETYHRGAALPPIRVRLLTDPRLPLLADARYRLIYGHSRLLAAHAAGHTTVETEIVTCSDAEALAMEARENFDRRNLNADHKAHAVATLIKLRLDEEQSCPLDTKGHRPEGGINKAARDEGLSEKSAHRAMRIAAITPDAKALYRTELPDIARIDLEAIAAAPSERQVEFTQMIIAGRKAGRPRTTGATDVVEQLAAPTRLLRRTATLMAPRLSSRRRPCHRRRKLRNSRPGLGTQAPTQTSLRPAPPTTLLRRYNTARPPDKPRRPESAPSVFECRGGAPPRGRRCLRHRRTRRATRTGPVSH
jgi:ParB-like chromosome segregation protein Spo0J